MTDAPVIDDPDTTEDDVFDAPNNNYNDYESTESQKIPIFIEKMQSIFQKMPTKTKQKIKDAPDVYANNDASSDAYV